VGAGLAGLCAAYELEALGHDVTVVEAKAQPGGRVQTLRDPFDDGLFAEAGASRIPTSHDVTLRYVRQFGLTLVPFEPASVPSIRHAYGERSIVLPGAAFEWPSRVRAEHQQTPAEVRRRHIAPLVDEITDPFSLSWIPASLKKFDHVTRDEYLRSQGVSPATLHMMNLGSTPVARFRSFLDVLYENAVDRELRRRAGIENDRFLKIEGGTDRLPRAFAERLVSRLSLPLYPPGFSRFPVFPPGEETSFSTLAPTSRSLMEKQTSRGSSVRSVTPIAPDDARTRNVKSRRIISAKLSTWSGINQFIKRQEPMWLSPWPI
jgi:monoamine oxidase